MQRGLLAWVSGASLALCLGAAVLWACGGIFDTGLEFGRVSLSVLGYRAAITLKIDTWQEPRWGRVHRHRRFGKEVTSRQDPRPVSDWGFYTEPDGVHFRLPYFVFLTLFGVLPITCVVRLRRTWRWKRDGSCISCGYSLIGNLSGTCPECGSPVPQKPEAPA